MILGDAHTDFSAYLSPTLVLAQDDLPVAAPVAGGGGAQTTGGVADPSATQGANQPAARPPGLGGEFLFLMLGLMVFMIVMSIMQGRKEKKKRELMLASLGRHDRVMTTGGMVGVVTDIRDDRVVLKVDESTNTRIEFNRAAVQTILKSSSSGATDDVADD